MPTTIRPVRVFLKCTNEKLHNCAWKNVFKVYVTDMCRIATNENSYSEQIYKATDCAHIGLASISTQKMAPMANKLLVRLTDLFPAKSRPNHLLPH